jgi:hypothetical protein
MAGKSAPFLVVLGTACVLLTLCSARGIAAAPPAPRDLIFFLHYVNATESAKAIPGSGSTWTYFDTTSDWNDVNATLLANGSSQSFDWYLSPALAGNFTVSTASLSFWAQVVSGVSSAQTSVELSERSSSGAETVVSTGNFGSESYTSSPGLKRLNWTLSGTHTFASGSSIKLTLKLNLGGGSLLILFDTARADSHLTLMSQDALRITGAQVLDWSGVPAPSLDPTAPVPQARLHVSLLDPLGGYDVAWVRVTVLNETGAPLVDNASATRVSGTPASLASTFEVVWNYSGLPGGRYVVFVTAMDGSGASFYTHFGNFAYGPYGDSFSFPAFIGGLPLHAWVQVVDDAGNPLEDSRVTLVESPLRGGEATTDAAGLVNLTAGPGLYTAVASWTQVEVARATLNLTDNITAAAPFELRAAVFYPTLRLVDNQSVPLSDAAIVYTHPNGSTTITSLVTPANGTVSLGRTAGGNYHVVARWGTLTVLDALWAVNASATTTLRAAVYYVDFHVLDSQGVGVAFATLIAREASSGALLAFALTDEGGTGRARIPGAVVEVAVWTRDIQVVASANLTIAADGPFNLQASVYYLAVSVVDSTGSAVEGARVTVRSSGGTVTETALTGADGNASLRVPASSYSLAVEWFGYLVAANASVAVASDMSFAVVVAVHILDLQVVDGRAVPVAGVGLALLSVGGANDIVALGITGPDGRAAFHAPAGSFRLEGTWRNVTVVNSTLEIQGDTSATLPARIGYLTVEVVDRESRPLNQVIVSVTPEASDGGLLVEYTGTNGTASYRLPAGNYKVNARLTATYLLSPIDQTVVTSVRMDGADGNTTVVMTEFQPAFVATNAFAIGLLFFLAMVGVGAFVYLRYQRPGRPDDDDGDGVEAPKAKDNEYEARSDKGP